MNKKLPLVLAAAFAMTLAASLPSKAEPALEAQSAFAAKDFDLNGINIAAQSGAGAVDARKMWASGTRNLAPLTASPKPRTHLDVASPAVDPAPAKPTGSSIGAKLCTAAGATAGFLGTLYLAVGDPLALAGMAVGGAVVGYAAAKREGLKGWKVVGATLGGANDGAMFLITAGAAVGRTVGKGLERLFKA